jgi:hypothetical protein
MPVDETPNYQRKQKPMPAETPLPRDLQAENDELRNRVEKLEKREGGPVLLLIAIVLFFAVVYWLTTLF